MMAERKRLDRETLELLREAREKAAGWLDDAHGGDPEEIDVVCRIDAVLAEHGYVDHGEGRIKRWSPPAVGDISPHTAAFASSGARPMDNLPQPGWRARLRMRLRTLFSRWTSGV